MHGWQGKSTDAKKVVGVVLFGVVAVVTSPTTAECSCSCSCSCSVLVVVSRSPVVVVDVAVVVVMLDPD